MACLNLRGEMARKRISIEDMSAFLGIHRNSVTNKLNGVCAFSIDESMKIQEEFFPDLELKYLFNQNKKGG